MARASEATSLHLLIGLRGRLQVQVDGAVVASVERATDREDDRLVQLPLRAGAQVVVLRNEPLADGPWTLRVRVLDARGRPGPGDVALSLGVPDPGGDEDVALDEVHELGRPDLDAADAPLRTSATGVADAARRTSATPIGDAARRTRATPIGDAARRASATPPRGADDDRASASPEPVARLTVGLPAGGIARRRHLRVGAREGVLRAEGGVFGPAFEVRVPLPARGRLDTRVEVGGERRAVGAAVQLDRPLLMALAPLAAALEGEVPDGVRGPAAWRLREGLSAVRRGEPDRAWRDWLAREARQVARALASSRNPFADARGYQRMAHISRLDGTAQPYELFVPAGRPPRGGWPLLVTLHGFKGNAGDYFRNTFGLPRDWRGGEGLDAHGRHGTPPSGTWGGPGPTPRGAPMIVIAPEARGQTHYRHAGEVDVLEAMADVRARYPVDESRIYLTGGSMGGTGAAYLPFRHPDLFAASASLAGYHDQRVRQDTHHDALSPVERFLVAHRSDVDWAENALHLPMLLVRGTRDRPLAWTRSLASRLDALRASGGMLIHDGQSRLPGGPRRGYVSEHREPELGHNVWTETYAGGAIFTWLGEHTRPSAPRDVRLRTARERTRSAFWVRDVVRASPDRFADVDARVVDGAVHVRTSHVAALSLALAPPLVPAGPLTVHIDGQTIVAAPVDVAMAAGAPTPGEAPRVDLRREGDRWVVGTRSLDGRKRPGVSGPIRDVYHEPLVFVVGTHDPDHTWINRRVAEHWARPRGWDVAYPIVDDVDVTPEMIAQATLVLVGPPRSNALHARWRRQLPIRFVEATLPDGRLVMDGAILVGRERHAGAQVGAAFVAPSPDVPGRSVLVLAGTTPLGTWRARFLPDILPDYVVFDEGVENARDTWSCGGARFDDGSENGADPVACAYRAHGFFGMDWRLRP